MAHPSSGPHGTPHITPGLRQGLPRGAQRWEFQGTPVRRGVEGRLRGGQDALWGVWGGVGLLLLLFLLLSLCQLQPSRTTRKNHCGRTRRDFFRW